MLPARLALTQPTFSKLRMLPISKMRRYGVVRQTVQNLRRRPKWRGTQAKNPEGHKEQNTFDRLRDRECARGAWKCSQPNMLPRRSKVVLKII